MGVGTNVQARAVALHHLDCPWRPADIQQREGRIIRQGNLNRQVRILRYVTEGSFDAYSWQTVTRKAYYIGQLMSSDTDADEIEDIDDTALSYDEVKALAMGNPLLISHAEARAELTRLQRLERSHHRGLSSLRAAVSGARRTIADATAAIELIDPAIAARVDTAGDRFAMTVRRRRYTSRPDALAALRPVLADLLDRPSTAATEIGQLGGFTVAAQRETDIDGQHQLALALVGTPLPPIRLAAGDIDRGDPVIRLENRLRDLEPTRTGHENVIAAAQREIAAAQQQLAQRFRHAQELAAAQARFDEVDASLRKQAQPAPPPTDAHRRELPVDSSLDPAPLLAVWANWPIQPTEFDRQWLIGAAADLACDQAVQDAAVAGDVATFTRTYDLLFGERVGRALDAGTLQRDGFWSSVLADPQRSGQLADTMRATAYATLRETAARHGIPVSPTAGRYVSAARIAFTAPADPTDPARSRQSAATSQQSQARTGGHHR
jgi:hypothetical protein